MYVVWVFISEISEGDVVGKAMLGLRKVWFGMLDRREDMRYVLQPVKERLVCAICLVRYIYTWVSVSVTLNPYIPSPGSTIINVYKRSSVWKTPLWSLSGLMAFLVLSIVNSRSGEKVYLLGKKVNPWFYEFQSWRC